MKIDSHHHLWTLERGDYGWLTPDLGVIWRDFTTADLAPCLNTSGISNTIVVQATDTIAETEFLLEQAENTDWIAGVVGWTDMESPHAISDLEALARNKYLKGIRPMIQGIEDDDWILRPGLDHVFDALIELKLTFDALVLPGHLIQLLRRMDRHPDLKCVIDHAAKPELAGGNIEDWKCAITNLAHNTDCRCKFSGLVTEAGEGYTIDSIRPASEHIISEFGAARLMFGSDWPVLNLASNYPRWISMVEELTNHFSDTEKSDLWNGTAADFYNV